MNEAWEWWECLSIRNQVALKDAHRFVVDLDGGLFRAAQVKIEFDVAATHGTITITRALENARRELVFDEDGKTITETRRFNFKTWLCGFDGMTFYR